MDSRSAALVLLVGVTLAVGFHPLSDLDLGWHLAGGLWMLEAGSIPRSDPFTVGAVAWINYSWLPELCWAAVYRLAGFEGLRLLQWLLILVSTLAIFSLASRRLEGRVGDIGALFAVVLSLPLLVPFWHLRPQLLSVLFFAIALLLLERRALTFLGAALLTVVWAACHVYWVLVPALWLLYRGRERGSYSRGLVETIMLFASGMISPYGAANLLPVFEYSLNHHVGYLLIDEFQPLYRAPFEASCFGAALLALLLMWRGERDGRLKLLLIGLALCSILQRKYLPLFAVVWTLLIAERITARLPERAGADDGRKPLLCALAFCAAVLCLLPRSPALAPRFQELLRLFEDKTVIAALKTQQKPHTFNHFDDGGWLALAATRASERFLTSIDGRTLVAGPVRLAEFHRLLTGDDLEKCAILERSLATLAIVPFNSIAFRRLFSADKQLRCADGWRLLVHGEFYEIWGAPHISEE